MSKIITTLEEAIVFCSEHEVDVRFWKFDGAFIRPRVVVRPNAWSEYEGNNLIEAVEKYRRAFYGLDKCPHDETGWQPE